MRKIGFGILLGLMVCFFSKIGRGQGIKPSSVSVAYWGEMVTHPGIKVEANYLLRHWEVTKEKKNGKERVKQKSFVLSPSLGVFYHRRYQTGISPTVNIAYASTRNNKRTFSSGVGMGYLNTVVPNTYRISASGEMKKVMSTHHYMLGRIFVGWGRNLEQKGIIPSNIYLKPQLMMAMPNFPNSIAYFMLEAGVKYQLN